MAHQLVNGVELFYEDTGSFGVDQTISGVEGVLQVESDLVLIAEGRGNASLRILRVGFCDFALGQHQDGSGIGEGDSGAESGDSRTNHHKVWR